MWNQKALSSASVTAPKLALVADKVMAKCDAIDGLKDGLIDDPRKCAFDPAKDVPACRPGADSASDDRPEPGDALDGGESRREDVLGLGRVQALLG